MSDCPPIAVAIAVAELLQVQQLADKFAMRFNVRWSFADWATHLEKTPNSLPWVDVVPPVKPDSDLDGRYWYKHGVPIRLGVRAKLDKVTLDWSEAMDPEAIKVYVNLLYQLKDYFDPSAVDNPRGAVLESYCPGAVVTSGCKVIKAWDPDLLTSAKVYCGIIEVPFALKVSRNA